MILLISDGNESVLKSALSCSSRNVPVIGIHSADFNAVLNRRLNDHDLQIVVIDCIAGQRQCLNSLYTVKKERSDVPVIFVVSSDSESLLGKALSLGARECFRKPLDVARFKERVSVLQKLKQSVREKRVPFFIPENPYPEAPVITSNIPKGVIIAIGYIEEHAADRDFSIDRVAKVAGMSPFHFCRTFKRHTSLTPMQFLVRKRLELAKELLKNASGNMNISQIAAAVGFYDSSNFNKHFKRAAGVTPSGYRQSIRPVQAINLPAAQS